MNLLIRRKLARQCELLMTGSIKDRFLILSVVLLPVVSWRAYHLVATWFWLSAFAAIFIATLLTAFLSAVVGSRFLPPKTHNGRARGQ